MSLTCAVNITTRNRLPDLQRTLKVIAQLNPAPDEVIVCADGCSDGTEEFIREHHPETRLLINPEPRGSIASRDAMMRAVRSDVLLSVDDDSYPLERNFIAELRAIFSAEPRLAVLTFPQRTDEHPATLTQTDFGPARFVGSYSNAGAAIRRAAFIELGGYPPQFWHMYEEPDFALRCAAAGWQVRFEPRLTIRHHYTSAQRSELRAHQLQARNEIWSIFLRCPAAQLPGVALFRAARQFGYARSRGLGWMLREPLWWGKCLAGLPLCFVERRAIPWPRYRAWMELVRTPITSEKEWEERFGAAPE